jgi:predicted Abi (CAAX) family protease
MNTISDIIPLTALAAVYFLPTIIAAVRQHQIASVFVVNLFTGWTFFGWVAALVMAVRDKPRSARV